MTLAPHRLHASASPGVVLSFENRVASTSSDHFLGVALDYYKADDGLYGDKWGNAGALAINFSTTLGNLARGLAPAVLRLGGAPQDSLVYETTDGTCPKAEDIGGRGGYYCSQVQPADYACLTRDRWAQINAFASASQMRLVFGLNACLGRPHQNASMDFSYLRGFLRNTARHCSACNVWAFELGNELDGTYSGSSGVTAQALGADLATLHEVLTELWPDAASRPKLLGPDEAAYTGAVSGFINPSYTTRAVDATQTDGGLLRGLTWHQYPYCSGADDTNGTVLSRDCLRKIDSAAIAMSALAAQRGIQAWAGETANCWMGGVKGVTDSFLDAFYYSYQLSVCSMHNISTVVRQTLVGGDYALIDYTTLRPNPSYWAAVLWRKLITRHALGSRVATSSDVLDSAVHSSVHCAAGGEAGSVVAFVINFSRGRSFSVSLETDAGEPGAGEGGSSAQGSSVLAYLLTGEPSGRIVKLNGEPLEPLPGGALPPLTPERREMPFSMPPQSIAFLQIPAAGASVCSP